MSDERDTGYDASGRTGRAYAVAAMLAEDHRIYLADSGTSRGEPSVFETNELNGEGF